METYQKLYNKSGVPCGMTVNKNNVSSFLIYDWFGQTGVFALRTKDESLTNMVFYMDIESLDDINYVDFYLYCNNQEDGYFCSYSPADGEIHSIPFDYAMGEFSDIIRYKLFGLMFDENSYLAQYGRFSIRNIEIANGMPNKIDYIILQ